MTLNAHRSFVLASSLLALAACGEVLPAALDTPALSSSEDALVVAPQVAIRVRGDNLPGLTVAALTVKRVSVSANGVALPVTLAVREIDLANTAQAWLIGSFALPVGIPEVKVTIEFATPGRVDGAAGLGSIEVRGNPVEFVASTANMARNLKVVAQVDGASSLLVTNANDRTMLPQFIVRY